MAAIWQEIVFWWRWPLICNNTVEINETVLFLSAASFKIRSLHRCFEELLSWKFWKIRIKHSRERPLITWHLRSFIKKGILHIFKVFSKQLFFITTEQLFQTSGRSQAENKKISRSSTFYKNPNNYGTRNPDKKVSAS